MTEPRWEPSYGSEQARLDRRFENKYLPDAVQRARIFESAARILGRGPAPAEADRSATGLALGYVQSGKTMSFTALAALAADNDYRIVIALLGRTDLLVDQNTERLVSDLELQTRDDYQWVHLHQPGGSADMAEHIDRYLGRSRRVLVTMIKTPARIRNAAELFGLSALARHQAALIIDDEADQASLNTRVNTDEMSRTYEEIVRLRRALGPHLYTQYTATPFAPLLLEARDVLSPTFVEILEPGPDYTGAEAFFIERRDAVVREIDASEAEDDFPETLPLGLRRAIGTFLAGAALLRANGVMQPPISMLVHPSHLTLVHAHHRHLVSVLVQSWAQRLQRAEADPGRQLVLEELDECRADLVRHGAVDIDDDKFADSVAGCAADAEIWLVNSLGEVEDIDWSRGPIHILVGGNKLDRGFTVKGLTVSYMTRNTGGQADTILQRARAFGYKRSYLRYCRIFAPPDLVDAFTGLVHTEDDMRAQLLEWIEEDKPLADWAEAVGLALPTGINPTRANVIQTPERFYGAKWHTLNHPMLDVAVVERNQERTRVLQLADAPATSFGSIRHRHRTGVPAEVVIDEVLTPWEVEASGGWEHELIVDYLRRRHSAGRLADFDALLMEQPNGDARVRKWDEPIGIPNLMQGSDAKTQYPGDRHILPDRPQLQVHRVRLRDRIEPELLTLALYVPEDTEFPSYIARRPGA